MQLTAQQYDDLNQQLAEVEMEKSLKTETQYIELPNYEVVEVTAVAGTKVECGGGCGWEGIIEDTLEIESCALTAGDPSPAGRCPECETLAYLVDPMEKIRDAAPDLLAAVEAQHKAIDWLMARLIGFDESFMPSQSKAWPAVVMGHAAIKKATQTL